MRYMGTAGHEKRISKIKTTMTNFKRLVGLKFEHPLVQEMANGQFKPRLKSSFWLKNK